MYIFVCIYIKNIMALLSVIFNFVINKHLMFYPDQSSPFVGFFYRHQSEEWWECDDVPTRLQVSAQGTRWRACVYKCYFWSTWGKQAFKKNPLNGCYYLRSMKGGGIAFGFVCVSVSIFQKWLNRFLWTFPSWMIWHSSLKMILIL